MGELGFSPACGIWAGIEATAAPSLTLLPRFNPVSTNGTTAGHAPDAQSCGDRHRFSPAPPGSPWNTSPQGRAHTTAGSEPARVCMDRNNGGPKSGEIRIPMPRCECRLSVVAASAVDDFSATVPSGAKIGDPGREATIIQPSNRQGLQKRRAARTRRSWWDLHGRRLRTSIRPPHRHSPRPRLRKFDFF